MPRNVEGKSTRNVSTPASHMLIAASLGPLLDLPEWLKMTWAWAVNKEGFRSAFSYTHYCMPRRATKPAHAHAHQPVLGPAPWLCTLLLLEGNIQRVMVSHHGWESRTGTARGTAGAKSLKAGASLESQSSLARALFFSYLP